MPFAFAVTCRLTDGGFEAIQGQLTLEQPLEATSLTKAEGVWTLGVHAGGFATEAEARTAGEAAVQALSLTGVLLGVGIDVGADDLIGHAPSRLPGGLAGLRVFEEPGQGSVNLVVGRPHSILNSRKVEEAIAQARSVRRTLKKTQLLAAVLYNQSHFHTSESARYLTLMSAIEVLSERKSRSAATHAFLEQAIAHAETTELADEEKEALLDGLRNLRKESISQASRRLVAWRVGQAAAVVFKRAYKIRSQIVHEGEVPADVVLENEASSLDNLVRRLIANDVAGRVTE